MPIASIRRIAVAASVAALLTVPTTSATADDHAKPAQPYPPSGRIFVTPLAFAGGRIGYLGTGFFPRERVTVKLDANVLGIDRANRRGYVSGAVRVPRDTSTGNHLFSLTGQSSGQHLTATVRVRRFPGRYRAETATVKLDAAPMANHVAKAEKAPGRTAPAGAMSAVGAAAALGMVGGGTYMVLRRRRRADNWRG